ncbi:hypothetical protein ACGF5O_19160 [Streptomyces sp. NPDC048291]|uniref:hypothetical protein n=1 Tax=Streptomyces sp. NPDC048291 TaxID=3365530 RepID=UPI00371AFCAF
MRDGTATAASLAALLVAVLMTGVSVAATGSGLGVRTEPAAAAVAPDDSALDTRTAGSTFPATGSLGTPGAG